VKGRKMGGGIRFGEMERDSLLAHGTSFLLHDRLMHCSDETKSHVCSLCGSLISPIAVTDAINTINYKRNHIECKSCNTDKGIEIIAVPSVFKYLVAELAAMNVKMTLEVK